MPDQALLEAQIANAESDRADALEEAQNSSEDREGYAREANRLRHQVRDLESALRVERHEHAETRRQRRPRASSSTGPNRSAYAVFACVFFIARFVAENPITQIGFAVAAFVLAVAFALSPRSLR